MKNFLLFVSLISIFACGGDAGTSTAADGTKPPRQQVPLESPEITITLEGLNATGPASLIGIFSDQHYKQDSAQVQNGTIHFKRSEPYKPGHYYLMLSDNSTPVQLLVDADQTFSMKASMNSVPQTMQVEGSLDNQLLYETLRFEEGQRPKYAEIAGKMQQAAPGSPAYQQLKTQQDALANERKTYLENIFAKHPSSLFAAFKKAGQNPDVKTPKKADGTVDTAQQVWTYRTQFWEGVDFSDERLLWTPVIANKLKRYMNELTPQQPDSIKAAASFLVDKTLKYPEYYKYFANWITLNYEPKKTTLMDSEAVFCHMIQKYFTYERAFWSDSVEVHGLQLRAYEMSQSLVGLKGPNVQVPDTNGKPVAVYDLKSPYILVYMWNPECEHCAEQTPKIVQNYNAWKSQGLDVYGIAVNTELAPMKAAIKKYGMQWTNVFDPTNKAIYATYFVDNTPELYVLNPDRVIIGKNLQWDQVLTIVERDKQKRR